MPGSATEAAAREAFARQSGWAEALGSPLMVRLCRLLSERLDRETEVGRRVLDWPGDAGAFADALPLRLAGGLHALVRSGEAPALERCYPPRPLPTEDDLWEALRPALAHPALPAWLDSAPQTNEVGRSAVLMSGLLVVAEQFGQPVELLELGASAGLNLLLDLYGYDLGGLEAGDPGSALRMKPEWMGDRPPAARVEVAARRGVDLNPLDPRRDGERLLAYVWPDQRRRLAQLEAALAIAAADPPLVDQGDAADWLEERLAEPRPAGTTRVVLHSIAFQYFPDGTRERIAAAMARAGAASSRASPLAWLRFEHDPEDERLTLRLRTWPGCESLLAYGHPHGKVVHWVDGSD
ncbi:MAG TPA: DUF2332 family protein [Allosphingosinicella sp.]|nr:DUF2332 family protein [Allosphingosinicella sp.]